MKVNNKLYKQVIKKKFNNPRSKAGTYTKYLVSNKKVLQKNIKNN